MTEESVIKLTAKLYEYRDTMRTIWGGEYDARCKEAQDIIRAEMKRAKTDNILDAALTLAKLTGPGIALAAIMAAAVEMVEPST